MAALSSLTPRQRQIYEFIRKKIDGRGFPPTVREIGLEFDIKSPNGVMCHLKALVKKGLIIRDKQAARAIQLSDHQSRRQGLPLLGTVAAGSPVHAIENADRIEFGELFSGSDCYALKVRGRSMIEDHIDDGDYVIIKQQSTATNGERVVAMIDKEVTLKRFYEEDDRIRLEPANGNMKPIVVAKDDAEILGVLVGVVRKC